MAVNTATCPMNRAMIAASPLCSAAVTPSLFATAATRSRLLEELHCRVTSRPRAIAVTARHGDLLRLAGSEHGLRGPDFQASSPRRVAAPTRAHRRRSTLA